jgi:hypothetical protein
VSAPDARALPYIVPIAVLAIVTFVRNGASVHPGSIVGVTILSLYLAALFPLMPKQHSAPLAYRLLHVLLVPLIPVAIYQLGFWAMRLSMRAPYEWAVRDGILTLHGFLLIYCEFLIQSVVAILLYIGTRWLVRGRR